MLGYMNRDALEATLASGFATFFSRSKQRLWQKGETSGNRLEGARRTSPIATTTPCSCSRDARRPDLPSRHAQLLRSGSRRPRLARAAAPRSSPSARLGRPVGQLYRAAARAKARSASPRRSARRASKSRSAGVSRDVAGLRGGGGGPRLSRRRADGGPRLRLGRRGRCAQGASRNGCEPLDRLVVKRASRRSDDFAAAKVLAPRQSPMVPPAALTSGISAL